MPTTKKKSSPLLQSSSEETSSPTSILHLPPDLQVNMLTYLRAYNLAAVQQTCRYYANPALIHDIVCHTAEAVYPAEWTAGFDQQPALSSTTRTTRSTPNKNKKTSDSKKTDDQGLYYTLEHLRNMELLVIARVLNSPEPASGFVVSRSWCKTALRWLSVQQDVQPAKKKLSKKKQRLRNRKLSDASPPWPNANSDLLCSHQSLQRCSNSKSRAARRRTIDKQAWKILKKLYPESTQLASQQECLQCCLEQESQRKNEMDAENKALRERKQPLQVAAIRRFYTRKSGVPDHSLVVDVNNNNYTKQQQQQEQDSSSLDCKMPANDDKKMPAAISSSSSCCCPLSPGLYYILPRAWCHGWRRFIRTGETPQGSSSSSSTNFPPPDATSLLCDAHRLALLPPHLEAYLYGESTQLLTTSSSSSSSDPVSSSPVAAAAAPLVIPGQAPDQELLAALGLNQAAVGRQVAAMRRHEQQQQRHSPSAAVMSKNELLDRENHSVVEILTSEEFTALEKWCWPAAANHSSGVLFCLRFAVDADGGSITYSTPVCRECDATGRRNRNQLSIKNRARGWVKKSAEKARAPASLEY